VFVEAAQALGRRVLSECGEGLESDVEFAFRLVLARPPQQSELRRVKQLYQDTYAGYQADPDQARKMVLPPDGVFDEETDVTELAAWTVVSNVLLNLDETLSPP
jgi:hypothetical protein